MRLTVFILFLSTSLYAQPIDSLLAVRKAFTTDVFKGSRKVPSAELQTMFVASRKWSTRYEISRIMLPASPVVLATGVYLGYDAIRGIPMEAEINGQIFPYTKRNLPKLLGGLALFAVGISLLESSNEVKQNAVNWYNSRLKSEARSTKNTIQMQLEWKELNRVGLVIKL